MSILDFLDMGGDDEGQKRRARGTSQQNHHDDDDRSEGKRGERYESDDEDEGFSFGRGKAKSGKKESPLDAIMDIFG